LLELAAAKKHGTRISFDLNYRASFWRTARRNSPAIFTEIASASDILVGNEETFSFGLGIEGPEAGDKGLTSRSTASRG